MEDAPFYDLLYIQYNACSCMQHTGSSSVTCNYEKYCLVSFVYCMHTRWSCLSSVNSTSEKRRRGASSRKTKLPLRMLGSRLSLRLRNSGEPIYAFLSQQFVFILCTHILLCSPGCNKWIRLSGGYF